MMFKIGAAVLVGLCLVGSTTSADAKRWNKRGECRAAIEGAATGKGVFGLGSQRAREAAVAAWEDEAEYRHGRAFANFSRASRVRWDCAKNALITAKCVVIARPCSARISG